MSQVAERLLTEDELIALGEDARIEIWDGRLVEKMAAGGLHQIIIGNIHDALSPFIKKNKLGLIAVDGLIYLMNKTSLGLKDAFIPDLSFVRKEQIPKLWQIERPFPSVPTLAVEVVSPDDVIDEVLKKVRQYLLLGTEEVWVVFPRQETVYQYRRETMKTVQVYEAGEMMTVEVVSSDLKVALSDFFLLPEFD